MKWFWKKKKSKLPNVQDVLNKEYKILDKLDADKIKGGRRNTNRIWNGCGGTIPQ